VKLRVVFSRKRGQEPIIARVILETGVLINVERARIDAMEGEVLIDLPDEDVPKVRSRLEELGVQVSPVEHTIQIDRNECVDCGACLSICPQEVFSFDEEWRLQVREDECVLCGKCIPACPHRALSLTL